MMQTGETTTTKKSIHVYGTMYHTYSVFICKDPYLIISDHF